MTTTQDRAVRPSHAVQPPAPAPLEGRTIGLVGYRPGSAGHRRITLSLFAAGIATFALIYSTQALLPELAAGFGVSSADSTLSLSVTTAALAVALLVAGPLSDRIGRTRLIRASLAVSVVLAAAAAFAPTWSTFLGLRLAMGVTIAGLPAVATAYLREELEHDAQAGAVGLYIGGNAIGGMVGRLATGPVAELWGWRWALVAVAGLGLVCTAIVLVGLPPSRHFVARSAGVRPMLSMARRAVGDPVLLALYAVGLLGCGAFVAVFNAIGFRLTTAPFGLGLGAASLVFLVYACGTLGSAVGGRLADRFGRRAVAPLGALLALAGLLLTLPDALPAIVAGMAVMTAGFFVVHGVASGWVPVRAHAGGVASAQAASLYLFAYYVGSSVLGTAGGHAFAYAGWSGVVALSGLLFAGAGLLTLVIRRTPILDRPKG
ncbi:MFS transporter [Knoellia subterranea]|uniref:MFS transporter n=1 Tax=Knoellia subterranea KCTC 19937 TaxID=1385521 RepID=A0A0A0JLI6_9MICO|nr:MFS transporter [Knoellia subterranea]KGN36476.1 MFS transporter [Knoellia subterranea KCTC 19937]